jgi:hypothetical protein
MQYLVTGCISPKLFESLVATAAETVKLISYRVLLVIVLVVFLGGIKFTGLGNLGYDRSFEGLVLFQKGL